MSSSDTRWAARHMPRDAAASPPAAPPPAPWPARQFSPPPPPPTTDFEDLSGYFSAAAHFRRAKGTMPGTLDFTPEHLQHLRLPPGQSAGATALRGSGLPTPAGARSARGQAHTAATATATAAAAPPAPDPVAQARAAWRQELLQELETELAERQAQADSDLQAQLHEARQAGYQDGYRDGLVALDNFKQSFAQQTTSQVAQLVLSLDQELRGLEQLLADSVTRTATELARQVVRSELALRPALIHQVAAEAMGALLKTARQVSIHLHPDDQALVAQGCADPLERCGARLVADATVARGGCVVDSDIGGIDARIATRWQLAARALGSPLAWQDDGNAPGADA